MIDYFDNRSKDARHQPKHFRRRGMTLVEILAVVVILGLVVGTLTIGFSGTFGQAKHELAKTGIGTLMMKVETYRISKSVWPPDDLGLSVLTDGQATPTDAFYVSRDQLQDPWNHNYVIILPGPNGHPFEIISYGADGKRGGEGEDADISSTNLKGNN